MKGNDLAIACAKKRVSSQTGYLHHNYHILSEEVPVTIPVIENVLYALVLLQTRTIENITEGKRLLERILSFQESESGNFPVYLHEFPTCTDCYQGVHLLAPFYWILKQFHQVLGVELKANLDQTVQKILTINIFEMDKRSIPDSIGIKIASAAIAFGKLNEDIDLETQGKALIKQFEEPSAMWYESRCLSEMMIALQMVSSDFSSFPKFWTHLCNMHHLPTASYAGPSLRELQVKEEPQVTLYDLFWASFTDVYPERVLRDHPLHLHAVLIQPTQAKILEKNYPFELQGERKSRSWIMYQNEKYAYAFIEQNAIHDPAKDKGFSPFHFAWGTPKRLHTFVCQNGNSCLKNFSQQNSSVTFIAELGEIPPLEDREKARELTFFFDIPDSVKLTVDGTPVNTFRANDEVLITVDGRHFRLSFEIMEGEGQFMGHFMRGNRPSQLANKGVNRFEAYDWQLFIRTIRRTEKCTLRIKINLS